MAKTTPWGKSTSVRQYERGISFVGTESHGGYLVARGYAKKNFSKAAQQVGKDFGAYLAYEEDCLAAVIDLELLRRKDGQKFMNWFYGENPRPSIDELEKAFQARISRWVPEYDLNYL